MLTLAHAQTIAAETLAEGCRLGLAPLACVVLDRGGHILTLLRDEQASIYRPEIAMGKAAGCLGMGFGGRELARRAAAMPMFSMGCKPLFRTECCQFPAAC